MKRRKRQRDDSFTSVTSISSEFSNDASDNNSTKAIKTKLGMGQNNTNTKIDEASSANRSPTTNKSVSRDEMAMKPNNSKSKTEFVEVLNSDEERQTASKKKQKKIEEKASSGSGSGFLAKVKEKLESLVRDSSSSSDDDYDEVEENNIRREENESGKSPQSRQKSEGKLSYQIGSILVGSSSEDGYDEVEGIEKSHSTRNLNRALRNWKNMAIKAMNKDRESAMLKTFAENITKSDKDGNAKKYNERALKNWEQLMGKFTKRERLNVREFKKLAQLQLKNGEMNERVVKNWEKIVSRVIAEMLNGMTFENVASRMATEQQEVKGKILKNWERIVSKLMNINEKQVSVKRLTSNAIFAAKDQVKKRRLIDNWERIVTKLLERNAEENVFQKMADEIKKDQNYSKHVLENWERFVTKLLEENAEENMFQTLADEIKKDQNDNKHVLENWERIVTKILEKNGRENMFQTLADEIKMGENDSKHVLKNWERIATKLLEKNGKNITLQKITEKVRLNKNSKKYLENWRRMVSKMIKKHRSVTGWMLAKQGENGDFSNTEETTSNCDSDNEREQRALKNWKRLVDKLLQNENNLKQQFIEQLNKRESNHSSNSSSVDMRPKEDENKLIKTPSNKDKDICSLCNTIFEYPILLPCSHTFCRDCITQLIDKSNGLDFRCPACGGYVHLSEEDEELFCPNFIVLKQMQNEKSGNFGCKQCGKVKPGDIVCEQCAEIYCRKCAGLHQKQKEYRKHSTVDISSVKDIQSLKRKYYCLQHTKQELTNYCLTCESSVCEKCARKNHNGPRHDCGSITDAAEAGREVLKNNEKNFDKKPKFKQEIKNINKMQEGLSIELAEMKTDIQNSIENLIAKLREQEARLYDEAEEKYRIINEALAKSKDDISSALLRRDDMREFVRKLPLHDHDVEMLQMRTAIGSRMQELIEMQTKNRPVVDYDFIFDSSNERKIEDEITEHGHIQVQDRNSGQRIMVEGFYNDDYINGNNQDENGYVNDDGEIVQHDMNDHQEPIETFEPLQTWSPLGGGNNSKPDHRNKMHKRYDSDSDYDEKKPRRPRIKMPSKKCDSDSDRGKTNEKERHRKHKTEQEKSSSKQDEIMKLGDTKDSESLTASTTYEFQGSRSPPADSFTQLTSERGEHISTLKYAVKDHKNETSEVQLRMICPDKSLVSAHVAESQDGVFTFFFCPETKKDFNCFITLSGKKLKKEYRILSFYGDFQGMKSREIDLTCRAMSLLRWHITPGLLERKHGKMKRSRKFLKILGSRK